jgi:hypothetical protein
MLVDKASNSIASPASARAHTTLRSNRDEHKNLKFLLTDHPRQAWKKMISPLAPSFAFGSGDTASGGAPSLWPFLDTSSAISNSTSASPPVHTHRCSSACSDVAGETSARNPSAGTRDDEAA